VQVAVAEFHPAVAEPGPAARRGERRPRLAEPVEAAGVDRADDAEPDDQRQPQITMGAIGVVADDNVGAATGDTNRRCVRGDRGGLSGYVISPVCETGRRVRGRPAVGRWRQS
jgi:hypothetical protein